MRKLSQNPESLVMTFRLDGTFVIQSEIEAYRESVSNPEYVYSHPLPVIQQAINEVTQ